MPYKKCYEMPNNTNLTFIIVLEMAFLSRTTVKETSFVWPCSTTSTTTESGSTTSAATISNQSFARLTIKSVTLLVFGVQPLSIV